MAPVVKKWPADAVDNKRGGFNPWIGKRKARQPTPVFLPGAKPLSPFFLFILAGSEPVGGIKGPRGSRLPGLPGGGGASPALGTRRSPFPHAPKSHGPRRERPGHHAQPCPIRRGRPSHSLWGLGSSVVSVERLSRKHSPQKRPTAPASRHLSRNL